jgi:hypothetical protein
MKSRYTWLRAEAFFSEWTGNNDHVVSPDKLVEKAACDKEPNMISAVHIEKMIRKNHISYGIIPRRRKLLFNVNKQLVVLKDKFKS